MALDELTVRAQQNNVSLPTDIDAKHKALIKKLSMMQGTAFDKAYQDAMINGHKAVYAMLNNESRYGANEAFRDYAMMYAPIVKEHLTMAAEGSIGAMKMSQ